VEYRYKGFVVILQLKKTEKKSKVFRTWRSGWCNIGDTRPVLETLWFLGVCQFPLRTQNNIVFVSQTWKTSPIDPLSTSRTAHSTVIFRLKTSSLINTLSGENMLGLSPGLSRVWLFVGLSIIQSPNRNRACSCPTLMTVSCKIPAILKRPCRYKERSEEITHCLRYLLSLKAY